MLEANTYLSIVFVGHVFLYDFKVMKHAYIIHRSTLYFYVTLKIITKGLMKFLHVNF